jgi:hypothetical protein
MRFLVWTWRVVLLVVVGAFVATAYYMTHDVGRHMDSAMPALNLISVIGAGLLGVVWTLSRRYWHTLILLVALGLLRGLFGDELLTEFQSLWVLVAIGVAGLVFVVTLTARALINDRALKAAKGTGTIQIPAQSITTVGLVTAPAAAQDTAVTEPIPVQAAEKESATLESTSER